MDKTIAGASRAASSSTGTSPVQDNLNLLQIFEESRTAFGQRAKAFRAASDATVQDSAALGLWLYRIFFSKWPGATANCQASVHLNWSSSNVWSA
ncbi:hypothetical protein M6B38_101360 [Iris pallida]|uniref:Uncharacterized protein n=1 Tax=Iris pallida TaxID=29817 RepID=A0AAX6ILK1_IRIPA|nr:hypothetical protein M6B38_101360 [Iris pallida]